MQTKRERRQTEMMLLPSLEERIPGDYYLRRLNRVLDLSFVHEAVRDRYCQDNGRPSIDPEVIVRLFLLQAITGRSSVRGLLAEVELHLGYRWFIGYSAAEPLPDHSTLSKALDRFGDDVFDELFVRSIEQCRQSGLIEGKVLHLDATTIRADLDRNKVDQPGSADADARFGRFPGDRFEPGYKQQTVVDDAAGVIVAVAVHPANESEHDSALAALDAATEQLAQRPEAMCADSAYASGKNAAACEERGVRLVSPPQRPKDGHNQFPATAFAYQVAEDQFLCPAGKVLRYSGSERVRGEERRRYLARRGDCQACTLRERCTTGRQRRLKVSAHHDALLRLRADSQTASFRGLYKRRAPVIEGVFAEAKQRHGLRRAWRRGLVNVHVQCLLIAAVLNFKRLAAARWLFRTLFVVLHDLWNDIWNALNPFSRIFLPKMVVVRSIKT